MDIENLETIKPKVGELPSLYADRIGELYSLNNTQEYKKKNAQFFTPPSISNLMSSFSKIFKDNIRMLDPACGTGILACTLAEYFSLNLSGVKSIFLKAYETDVNLINLAKNSFDYLKEYLKKFKIEFEYELIHADFILSNSFYINDNLSFENSSTLNYDSIICNPPYFKLSKSDERTIAVKSIINGQPNIYSIFMSISSRMLNEDGELIFITPRSFTSGRYFKLFRDYFFKQVCIENIHLFASRKKAFSREKILQETMILTARKKPIGSNNTIMISTSNGSFDIEDRNIKSYDLDYLIDIDSKEKIIHLPTNDIEEKIVDLFKTWTGNLNKFNIQISTGPVVSFRAKKFIERIVEVEESIYAPLFWLENIKSMSLIWPIKKENKEQFIRVNDESKSLLIPNKNYIFLRRFSSKDDKCRLIAAPYFCSFIDSEYVGVENKVNYIYRPGGFLNRNEVVGLCALLNSPIFDIYFRTFNGNVNVSATELRDMPLPPLEIIKSIGEEIILTNNYSIENISKIVNDRFEFESILNK
ncbi:MAG: Eco57I restriction-modification methylase domain-containing protein [Ignavibacteria bacterium]